MKGWRKKRQVMKRYDTTAHLYDMRYSAEQNAKIEAALKHINVGKEGWILDVGCGTGLLFQYITGMAEDIVGVDTSRRTLIHALERARGFPDVHLVRADADNMPFKNRSFRCTFAVTLIQNSPKPLETLIEIKRVSQDSTSIITGLKKCFSLKKFKTLLDDAGFEILELVNDHDLKCYVAVCRPLL
jgi:ubiquinone/menaquinone biosynthesis C-methylase UbiE